MVCVGDHYASEEFVLPSFDEPFDRDQQLNAARQFIIVNLLQKVCAFYDSTPAPFLAQALEYIKLGILNQEWQPFLQNPPWPTDLANQPSSDFKARSTVSKLLNSLIVKSPLPRSSPYIGFHRHSPPCGRFGCRSSLGSYCSGRKLTSRTPPASPRDTADGARPFDRTPVRPVEVSRSKSSAVEWSGDELESARFAEDSYISRSPAPITSVPDDIVTRTNYNDIIQLYQSDSYAVKSDATTPASMPNTPRMLDSVGARLGLGPPMTPNLSIFKRDFTYIRTLGQGAFGVVYEVQNKLDLKKYAVKAVMFNTHDEGLKAKALREVQSWSRARHPHVCRYAHAWVEPSWALQMFGSNEQTSALDTLNKDIPAITAPVNERARRGLSTRFDNRSVDSSYYSDMTTDSLVEFIDDGDESATRYQTVRRRTESSPKASLSFPQTLFIQMELCEDTLSHWCHSQLENMSPNDMNNEQLSMHVMSALTIFGQLLSALEHVHELDIVHRDIKPTNIYRATDDCWVLGDFGLSKSIHETFPEEMAPWSDSSLESGVVGTAAYSAPEQMNGGKVTTAADIYSLGLVLLENLMLFPTMHERADSFRLIREGREVPGARVMKCFPNVGAFILAVTSPDPNERPTASSLLNVQSRWRRAVTHELQAFCQKANVEPRDVWQLPMRSPSLLISTPSPRDTDFAPLCSLLGAASVTDCGVQTDF